MGLHKRFTYQSGLKARWLFKEVTVNDRFCCTIKFTFLFLNTISLQFYCVKGIQYCIADFT